MKCFMILTLFIATINMDDQNTRQKTAISANFTAAIDKPKVNEEASALCKKCRCDLKFKQLECTNLNLTWFNYGEFNTIQNGNVQFEIIRLDHNYLEKISILPELTVKKMILAYNQIKSIQSTAFKNLVQMEILDLSHNRISSKVLTPAVFEGRYSASNYEPLDRLRELDLSYNELHTLDPDLFEHLPNLEKLCLSGNVFQVIDHLSETAIASLSSLRSLDLSYMELKTLPEYILHPPREKLEKLILTGNLFEKVPTALAYAINLRTLILDENPLSNIERENIFPRLKTLGTLSISFLKHTKSFGKAAFSGLENLRELYATNNVYLSDIHPSALARLVENETILHYPPIEKLFLHNNNLTVLYKTLLGRWDKVKLIDIRMNPWKCDTDNDFLLHDLFPQILANTPELTTKLLCDSPQNYQNIEIREMYEKYKTLHGPDLYGSYPENEGAILIGMLLGLLIGIPIAFTLIVAYRRSCLGLIRRPKDYGGALYKRADLHDDI